MRRVRAWAAAIALSGVAACSHEPTAEELSAQFAEAERLCLEAQFAEAKVQLKNYLLHDPLSPGAHYYLARTYMLSQDFRPAMAEGEFQTALRLFLKNGRASGIKRFTPEYFEMMCYLDSAKVIALYCDAGLRAGAAPSPFREHLSRALGYLESAKKVMPDAAELEAVGGPVRAVAAEIGIS